MPKTEEDEPIMPELNIKSERAEATRGRVLVVDDEEHNRTLLSDSLEALGYEVALAENGLQALQRVAENPPDVVLLDIMMPKMDGFQVCRWLKEYKKTAHIPVLMVSALSERDERLAGIAAGANDFLNKPLDIQDITLRVGNAVQSKHLFDQLRAEQIKSELLLLNMIPKGIAERMKKGEVNITSSFPEVTVLMADLVGFTTMSTYVSPEQVVSLLDELFSIFDALLEKHDVEKIKTMGDAYMAVGGLHGSRPDHAQAIACLALEIQQEVERFNRQYSTSLQIRIGINTGPVIAGVIGRKKFAYDVWGDAVNIACRLQAVAESGCIRITQATYEKLKDRFRLDARRSFDLKGLGEVMTYRLIDRSMENSRSERASELRNR